MHHFDPEISAKAFKAPNGELAWHRRDIPIAIDAVRLSGLAILGWEVWLIDGDQWTGLIPSTGTQHPSLWSFETAPRLPEEPWAKYCDRTATEALAQIQSQPVESESAPKVRDRLRFNLTYVEYVAFKHSAS